MSRPYNDIDPFTAIPLSRPLAEHFRRDYREMCEAADAGDILLVESRADAVGRTHRITTLAFVRDWIKRTAERDTLLRTGAHTLYTGTTT